MDFTLSKQQQMVQKMYKEFAENEVKPLAKKVDAEEYFPVETVQKMAKLGMMGIYFPKEVGGAGGDVLSYVMAVEEMSKVCGTTGVIISAHTSLCAAPIFENGTPEQKAKYLPKLCSGEWIGAFGLTEPGAGTDAQGQQTFAVDEGDHWKLNGSKIFITNAGYANVFIIIAVTGFVTDKRGRKQKEISAFIVERTDPGFKVGKPEDKMGIRGSSTCELIMEDCIIPKDRLLGVKGKGFQLAMATLDGGRIGIAAQALGIAEGALDETVAYVKERKQFGRSIAAFQNTQFELAEMKARVDAAKFLVYQAALKKQSVMDGAKARYSVEAAEAKLIAARTASDVTRRCLQLFGGYGYTRDYPIERMMRDAKITEIYEGTSEVQMMVISGAGKVAVKADGTMDRAAMATITNPDDLNAVEAALQLKDETGCEVVVVTMGPPPAEGMLRELIARGADRGVLVSGREFGGSDTFATSQILAAAVNKIGVGPEDIVFCGRQAIDGDTAQVGPQIAEKLHLPQVTYVTDIKKEGNAVVVKRQLEDGYMELKVNTPCLLTCIKELNNPRYMSVSGIFECYDKPIDVFDYNTLKDDPLIETDTIGLKGSPTNVYKSFAPPVKGAGMMVEDAAQLVGILNDKHLI